MNDNDDDTNIEPVELSPTRAELIARVRSRGRQIRARRRVAVTGLAALLVAVLAAPAIAIGAHSTSPRPADTARPAVSAHIELPGTTFVAGTSVHGTLVVENDTGRSVTLENAGERCQVSWQVTLTNAQVPNYPAWRLGCSLVPTVFAPGINQYPVTLSTSYNSCGFPATAPRVHCLGGKRIPPLPPGSYRAVLAFSPHDKPLALSNTPAVRVRVVANPPPDLDTRIELPGDTFVAGDQIHGTIVIENNTDQPITLESAGECRGQWDVVLTSPAASAEPAWTADCSTLRTVIPPGSNRYPVTIITTYSGCVGTGAGNTATRDLPLCVGGAFATVPPFPAGDYTAEVATSTPGFLPAAPPVTVHLTAP